MENIDIRYLCTTIGNLAGVPIRIFEGDRQIFYYSIPQLPRDPMNAYRGEILAVPGILFIELTVAHLVNNQAGRAHQAIEY